MLMLSVRQADRLRSWALTEYQRDHFAGSFAHWIVLAKKPRLRGVPTAGPTPNGSSYDGGPQGKRMISTRNLSLLSNVDGLRRLLQSMAVLDAILCREWLYRYYSFNNAWSDGEQMGSMRSGSGDHLFAHFSAGGCWLKGFAHESEMSPHRVNQPRLWPGILDDVPAEFMSCLQEPAFGVDDVTFCIWHRYVDSGWQIGKIEFPPATRDPDGSALLLSELDGRPESFRAWASEYYEREIELTAVEHFYRHSPATLELVGLLNPQMTMSELASDIREIGYPR